MTKPLIVEFPHDLGQVEARRRLDEGLTKAKATVEKSGVRIDDMTWTADTLNFGVSALGQRVNGQVDVHADFVRLEVRLPMLLSFFADKLRGIVGKEGTKLLTKR